jgi:biopolymer transport protein ExbB/TolQ
MPLSNLQVIEGAKRASDRSAMAVHQDMKRGLNSLATIASIAPLVGLGGTLIGMVSSFQGVDGERSALMAAYTERLSESLIPTALGLLVAIPAFLAYRYFRSELELMDVEMQNMSLQLTNWLSNHLARRD